MSADEIAALVNGFGRIVITGGEPLAQDISELVRMLRGRHITVETSGTIFADLPDVSLFSISPKVGTSGYTPKPAVLRKYFATAAGRLQLKFVIADARDVELARQLGPLRLLDEPVWVVQADCRGIAGRGRDRA